MKIIKSAIKNTMGAPKQGPAYFERPRGSYIPAIRKDGTRAAEFLSDLVYSEADPGSAGFGACRYFRADGVPGVEAIAQVKDLHDGELAQVRVFEHAGNHREGGDNSGSLVRELVAPALPEREVDFLHVCVGNPSNPFEEPTEETAVVFMWAPGKLTPKVDIPEDAGEWTLARHFRERIPEATVKLGAEAQLTIGD